MAVDIGKNIRPVGPKADELPVESGAEAFAHGQHIHRFQQVCLPLGIRPADDIGAGVKVGGLKVVVAKAV